MKFEVCKIEGHEEEQIYVCKELQCIEVKDNQLLCQQCLCKHKGMHFNKVKENAYNKYDNYMQLLQVNLEENQELKNNIEQQMKEIQGKFFKLLSDLQKNIFSLIDQQSQIISQNKTQAQKLMKESQPQLDLYLYFCVLSTENVKQKLDICKQQMKKITYNIISELNQKIEYLNKSDISYYKVTENQKQLYTLESIFKKKIPYDFCQEDYDDKTSICTHIDCLKSKTQTYHCLRCSKSSHVEHFQNNYLVEYQKLKKQQTTKEQLQEKQKQVILDKAQELSNQQITQLRQEQKEQYQKYETSIEKINQLGQKFYNQLYIQDTNYVFGDLLLQLISTTEQELIEQINRQYITFQKNLQACRIQDQKPFDEQLNKIQNDESQIIDLKKYVDSLKQQLNDKNQCLKYYISQRSQIKQLDQKQQAQESQKQEDVSKFQPNQRYQQPSNQNLSGVYYSNPMQKKY